MSKESHRATAQECVALRDLVSKLRQELLLCKTETQKVKDQLQCLIYLVRRSWSGDQVASIHVANIVGVAPPDIKTMEERNAITAVPKSRAVNNWAMLCIGLLNRMYREEELELRASQLMYLQDREGYLDEQLSSHKDVMHHQANMTLLRTNTLQLLQAKEQEEMRQRKERREQMEKQRQELRTQYSRKHPPQSRVHHHPLQESVHPERELVAGDALFVKPVTRKPVAHEGANEVVDLEATTTHHMSKGGTTANQFSDENTRKHPNATSDGTQMRINSGKTNKHVRSQTADGSPSKPRPKTAGHGSRDTFRRDRPESGKKPRPVSAHLAKARTVKPPPAFDTSRTRHQLELIERDLRKTTKGLQDRLGISRQGMV
ncbi:uncharacterized protein LOC5504212 isoform X2 [Nematostella vectensis]|uniref:uncharacterized protein LOC5504212 isoform X2 n=1 Tax=Nematostella vectensis TaxID=45351 RepID=UPI00207706FA|nr:uncharacterized protein LOC5504212 isoform X2 [Nematostella vectensis]